MARARSAVWVSNTTLRSVEGLEAVQRRLAAIPAGVIPPIQAALQKGAGRFLTLWKSVAPVSELEPNPGQLRDSGHIEPGDHELSIRIVADARDEKGRPIGAHVEYGHMAADGSHVAAVPSWWPVYWKVKKPIRSSVARAMAKGAKAEVLGGAA